LEAEADLLHRFDRLMIVVSNTSPLHYLIAVQQAEALPQLFEMIYVPPLSFENCPTPTRRRLSGWAATASLGSRLIP
jgi:predicted nucleic acid-binding protein